MRAVLGPGWPFAGGRSTWRRLRVVGAWGVDGWPGDGRDRPRDALHRRADRDARLLRTQPSHRDPTNGAALDRRTCLRRRRVLRDELRHTPRALVAAQPLSRHAAVLAWSDGVAAARHSYGVCRSAHRVGRQSTVDYLVGVTTCPAGARAGSRRH